MSKFPNWGGSGNQIGAPCLLLVPVLLCFASPALAKSKDICRTFAVTPKTFATLKLNKTKQYENRRFGVYAKYTARNQILSIFKYDDSQSTITDSFLQERLTSSSKAIRNSVRKRKDKILAGAKPFVWKMGDALFYGVSYKVNYIKFNVNAYEYVGLSHNTACMLKVRYTDALKATPGASLKRYKSYTRDAHGLFE